MDALMVGVSGMRGTIGGSLTPARVADLAAAFAVWLKKTRPTPAAGPLRVVFGRDSRPSGPWLRDAAVAALTASGVEVTDLDVVTTPGVAMMVQQLSADGGVVATASHNPIPWNGLKLLTADGVAPPAADAAEIVRLFHDQATAFVPVADLPEVRRNTETHALHTQRILSHVDVLGISTRRYKVVLDSVNGAGAVPTATLLSKLGCRFVHLHGAPHGQFAHDPEPTEKNLTQLAEEVQRQKADVGFAQDPDGDRLAIVDETGRYIGEEYTQVLCAKWLLSRRSGVAVTNLSSSRMLDDVAASHGSHVVRTPVGEAHVSAAIRREDAVVGGEGNGGVIDPRIVAGRDSLVAVAYVLQLMAATGKTVTQLVAEIPRYEIVKEKFPCDPAAAAGAVAALKIHFSNEKLDLQDGIRIDWLDGWVHARASNTEPIMRIIAEAPDRALADERVRQVAQICSTVAPSVK
jgi:phosphomannomutase